VRPVISNATASTRQSAPPTAMPLNTLRMATSEKVWSPGPVFRNQGLHEKWPLRLAVEGALAGTFMAAVVTHGDYSAGWQVGVFPGILRADRPCVPRCPKAAALESSPGPVFGNDR